MNPCTPNSIASSRYRQTPRLRQLATRLALFFLGSMGLLANGVAAGAQGAPATAPAMLSAEQGRGIASAALDEDSSFHAQDCSHLVHQIYSAAGYDYPYASSYDLYAGNGSFRRVRHAQPGDLITWPGHVGIVVNPRQHSFYSLVRSGLQTEDYLGPYWRSRGTPRFYRYVLGAGSRMQSAKLATPSRSGGKNLAQRGGAATAEIRSEPYDAGSQSSEDAALRSKVPAEPEPDPPATVDSEPDPSGILVTTEQRRPTAAELLRGILERNDGAAAILRSAQSLAAHTPIVIFDEIRVQRTNTRRDKGWAQLQIDSHVCITGQGPDFKRRHEKVRWELRRDASGWTVFTPPDRSYVSRDAAVRVLAAQLAEMTQSDAAAQHDENIVGQEARIANLLSALLEK